MLRLTVSSLRCSIAIACCLVAGISGSSTSAQTTPATPATAASVPPAGAELRVFDPSLVDKSVDPCENFYRFSCNGWFKRNPLPADQTSYGRFTELHELNRLHSKLILEEAATPNANANPRTANEQKIGDEYATCMDTATINRQGLAPLQPELDRIAALKTRDELPALLAHLHAIGVNAFFGMGSNQDYADSASVISFYGAGGLGLPERDYYTRTDAKSVEQRQQYVEHVRNIFALLGEPQTQAVADAKTVLALETRLAKASLTITEQRDPKNLNHPSDVAAFSKQLTHFSLAEYVTAAHAPASGKLNDTEPKFFSEFNTLVADTPIDHIKTYLRWHLLHAYAGASLPEAFDHENWHFYSHILNGAEKEQERWKRCTSRVDYDLGEALGQAFVAKYFPPAEKKQALEMTLAIEQAMGKDIDALDWMSAETKVKAREKLHTVMNKIGYPDKWRDYSALEITPDDFAGNVWRASQFEYKRQLAKIGKPLDRGEWMMTPPTVNAGYNPQMNDIMFPAGVLQPPLFDPKLDDAPNYGNTGATIGHELTHGFDDEGRQFDALGNLKDWWTEKDAAEFERRSKCVSDQYSGYIAVDDIHINGKLTNGEDIADLGGTMLAYYAWKHATAGQQLEPVGGFTPDQRFFIGMAQWACGDARPEMKREWALTDPHSPLEYRINGVVSNMPEFAQAFSCQVGQPMVRQPACRVW